MEAKSVLDRGIMQGKIAFIGLAALLALLVIAAGCTQPANGKTGDGQRAREINDFAACVEAGYPVMESYPRQCRTPNGLTLFEKIEEDGTGAGAFCGSETGIPCAPGFDCQLHGNYPDAGGKCVKAEVRLPTRAREGERCGGFDSRACEAGLICNWTDGPPGSSDMGSGSCVRVAETAPPLPPQEGNGCILMRNRNTQEMDCFGCGKTTCIDPIPDFEPYQRPPDEVGIPYSCYIDEEGSCALAQ